MVHPDWTHPSLCSSNARATPKRLERHLVLELFLSVWGAASDSRAVILCPKFSCLEPGRAVSDTHAVVSDCGELNILVVSVRRRN